MSRPHPRPSSRRYSHPSSRPAPWSMACCSGTRRAEPRRWPARRYRPTNDLVATVPAPRVSASAPLASALLPYHSSMSRRRRGPRTRRRGFLVRCDRARQTRSSLAKARTWPSPMVHSPRKGWQRACRRSGRKAGRGDSRLPCTRTAEIVRSMADRGPFVTRHRDRPRALGGAALRTVASRPRSRGRAAVRPRTGCNAAGRLMRRRGTTPCRLSLA